MSACWMPEADVSWIPTIKTTAKESQISSRSLLPPEPPELVTLPATWGRRVHILAAALRRCGGQATFGKVLLIGLLKLSNVVVLILLRRRRLPAPYRIC